MHLLLVEDDTELARQTSLWLRRGRAFMHWREKGGAALIALGTEAFDAVILDVGLPDMDGFTVVEQMRARGFGLPVLFLTARDNVTDRVRGLKAGGDDYVTKPFAVEELMARLEALQRRSGITPADFHAHARQMDAGPRQTPPAACMKRWSCNRASGCCWR
jgi:two-component system OmpR family response regulator